MVDKQNYQTFLGIVSQSQLLNFIYSVHIENCYCRTLNK